MASVNNTLQGNLTPHIAVLTKFFGFIAFYLILTAFFQVPYALAIEEGFVDTPETLEAVNERATVADDISTDTPNDFYSFDVTDISGNLVSLGKYRGKVSLVVNVASECGYTDDHYKDLVKLHKSYSRDDFNVLAFPCNQFGSQEPGSNHEIEEFARTTYRVDFPMFAKINVLNSNIPEAWQYLIDKAGEPPNWNFWKYLVNHKGHLVNAWGPWVSVSDITMDVQSTIQELKELKRETGSSSTPNNHGGEL